MTDTATIENNTLTIGDHVEALPILAQAARVLVWTVPLGYQANGYFVAVTPIGSTPEVPACSLTDTVLVADLHLPASATARLLLARLEKWEAIKAKRDSLKSSGVLAAGKWYHSDPDSRTQQLGLVIMGANILEGLQWKTLGGFFVTMTPTLAGQILGATGLSDQAIFSAAEVHRLAVNDSATPGSYDFSGGWPAAYEQST